MVFVLLSEFKNTIKIVEINKNLDRIRANMFAGANNHVSDHIGRKNMADTLNMTNEAILALPKAPVMFAQMVSSEDYIAKVVIGRVIDVKDPGWFVNGEKKQIAIDGFYAILSADFNTEPAPREESTGEKQTTNDTFYNGYGEPKSLSVRNVSRSVLDELKEKIKPIEPIADSEF